MKRNYILKHWAMTLLLAPLLLFFYEYFRNTSKEPLSILLENYIMVLCFSFLFSIPTLIIYYIVFSLLIKQHAHPILTKLILIGLTIAGIATTLIIIGGSLIDGLTYSFSISVIVIGILIPIRTKATAGV